MPTIDIVYIGDDLFPGKPPIINETYVIVKAPSTSYGGPLGAQLRVGNWKCGWVRSYDLGAVMHAIEEGHTVCCSVTSTTEFQWNGSTCFWGEADWWCIPNNKAENRDDNKKLEIGGRDNEQMTKHKIKTEDVEDNKDLNLKIKSEEV